MLGTDASIPGPTCSLWGGVGLPFKALPYETVCRGPYQTLPRGGHCHHHHFICVNTKALLLLRAWAGPILPKVFCSQSTSLSVFLPWSPDPPSFP